MTAVLFPAQVKNLPSAVNNTNVLTFRGKIAKTYKAAGQEKPYNGTIHISLKGKRLHHAVPEFFPYRSVQQMEQ